MNVPRTLLKMRIIEGIRIVFKDNMQICTDCLPVPIRSDSEEYELENKAEYYLKRRNQADLIGTGYQLMH